MKAMLHEVTGKNKYCGPTAIATVLGVSTDDASRMIRARNGKPSVRGLTVHDLVEVLRVAGCHVRRLPVHGNRPTLAAWLRDQAHPKDRHVIVLHAHHYGTFLGNKYLCSLTGRSTVGFKDIPKRRGFVEEVIVIDKLPFDAPDLPKPVRPADVERGSREKARALAKLHDIEIEVDFKNIIVWGPKFGLDPEDDPYDGDHYAEGWPDALERIETYVKISNAQLAAA